MSDPHVYGQVVDDQTRCVHYCSPLDIVALRFGCCENYYPCFKCHDEAADHPKAPWPRDRSHEPAVLCGVCWEKLVPRQYIGQERCPSCGSEFNPACSAHYEIYFEL